MQLCFRHFSHLDHLQIFNLSSKATIESISLSNEKTLVASLADLVLHTNSASGPGFLFSIGPLSIVSKWISNCLLGSSKYMVTMGVVWYGILGKTPRGIPSRRAQHDYNCKSQQLY